MGQDNSKVEEKSNDEEDESDDGSPDAGPEYPGGATGNSSKAINSTKEQHLEDSSEFAIKYHHAGSGSGSGPFKNLLPIDLALEDQAEEGGNPTTPDEQKSTRNDVYTDVMAFLMHCPRHGRFALYTDARSDATWFPFIRLPDAP